MLIELEGLSGNYMERIVTTIDVCDVTSSSNASGLDPPVVGKFPLVKIKVPPRDKVVAGSDGVPNSNGNAPSPVVAAVCLQSVRVNVCRNCQRAV